MRPPAHTHNPPPVEPPPGVVLRTAWVLGAEFWYMHVPGELDAITCGRCGSLSPCPSFRYADWFLSSLLSAQGEDRVAVGRVVVANSQRTLV